MNAGMNEHGPGTDEYETPPWLYRALNSEFGFTFDAAARIEPTTILIGKERKELRLTKSNALCERAATADRWMAFKDTDRIYCNPPYSNISPFVETALRLPHNLWVFLLPSTGVGTGPDNGYWYRRLFESKRLETRPFTRRISFYLNGVEQGPARFGSFVGVLWPT